MMRIEASRLLIRTLQSSDVAPLAAIWSDPQVTKYMGGPRDPDNICTLLEEDATNPNPLKIDLWPVIEKASERVVGHCGLIEKEVDGQAEIEVVYVFEPSSWGKGYATETTLAVLRYAFGELGLQRVIALIDPENTASERVAVKVGMSLEKDVVRPDGKVRWMYVVHSTEAV